MSSIIPGFSERSISPVGADRGERGQESDHKEQLSPGGLRSNKFSFSNLLRPIASRPQPPSNHSESPLPSQWSSRVASFVGSLFDQRKTGSGEGLGHFTIDRPHLNETITHSSPEAITIVSPSPIGLENFANNSEYGSIQETTLPQQGYIEAGDEDRKAFVVSLAKKLKEARLSDHPEEQLQKDIGRISYFLNGKSVTDIETIRTFFGVAARSILPVLNQTIPNLATEIMAQHVFDKAPVNTVHAELSVGNSDKGGNSIRVTKGADDSIFHIEIESIGTSNVFFKRGATPEIEIITLPEEDSHAPEKNLSATAMQLIVLELRKTDSGNYEISCSNLFRKYSIQCLDRE